MADKKPSTTYSSDMLDELSIGDIKEYLTDAILDNVVGEESYQLQIYDGHMDLYLNQRQQCFRIIIVPKDYKTGGPIE